MFCKFAYKEYITYKWHNCSCNILQLHMQFFPVNKIDEIIWIYFILISCTAYVIKTFSYLEKKSREKRNPQHGKCCCRFDLQHVPIQNTTTPNNYIPKWSSYMLHFTIVSALSMMYYASFIHVSPADVIHWAL